MFDVERLKGLARRAISKRERLRANVGQKGWWTLEDEAKAAEKSLRNALSLEDYLRLFELAEQSCSGPMPIDPSDLIERARQARHNAYAPYSNYKVGAALLAANDAGDERVFWGCNVETAAYTGTHAEETAIVHAIVEGYSHMRMIAVVTEGEKPGSPCGLCRQALYEFNPEMIIVTGTADGEDIEIDVLDSLLPKAFGPADLGVVR